MKKLTALLLTIILSSCASYKSQLGTRGYSEEDIALMKPYIESYSSRLVGIGAFGTAGINVAEENVLKTIFCNCHKKHGDACRNPSTELTGQDKTLWVKSSAARYVLERGIFGNGVPLDNDECAI